MRRWVDVKGYEGLYQVSHDGHVRSLPDIDPRGRFMPGQILSQRANDKGYLCVVLSRGNQSKTHKVHRLVACAFLSPDPSRPQVNHRNGVKTCNSFENLEWSTNGENQAHRYQVLRHTPAMLGRTGANCPNSKAVRGRCVKTGVVTEYGSAAEASRALGKGSGSAISLAANGNLRSAYGVVWEWA